MSFTHKTTFLALGSLLAFAVSSSSFADSCDTLLKTGIYNVTQGSSETDSQLMAKSQFCSADYSLNSTSDSQKAAINASYGPFSGGASGATTSSQIIEAQKNACGSNFNSEYYKNQASAYSRTIYQGALDAWNQCLALNTKGVKFEIQPTPNMHGVTVTLSAVAGTTAKFLGVSQFGGLGRSVCKTTLPVGTSGKSITINETTVLNLSSASSLIINCDRQLRLDSAGNYFANEQTLSFNTSAGGYQVPMVALGALSRTSIDKATAQISAAALANVQAALSASTAQVTAGYQSADTQLSTQISSTNSNLQNQINNLNGGLSSLSGSQSWAETVSLATLNSFSGNCTPGSINCMASIHRYCQSKGAKGGFMQEWDSSTMNFVCVK